MNGQTTSPQTAVVVAPKREIRVVEDESPAAFMLDTAKFEHLYRVAEAMSQASLLPKHLRGASPAEAKANCFLVVNQAMAWKLNPFLIMGETYEVGGKLGFQGKLIISVMNTRAGLRENLSFEFNEKRGDELAVTVSGRFIGEDNPRTVTVAVGQVKTQNQMWIKDPEQKLIYTAAIRWARRHAPEVVMGVMIEEDMEAIREEAHVASLRQIKSPVFEGPQPALNAPPAEPEKPKRKKPTLVEEPLDPPKPVEQAPPEQAQQTVPVVPTSPVAISQPPQPAPAPSSDGKPGGELINLCTANSIPMEHLIVYLKKERWMSKDQTKVSEMSEMKLKAFAKTWQDNPGITGRIKKANELKEEVI